MFLKSRLIHHPECRDTTRTFLRSKAPNLKSFGFLQRSQKYKENGQMFKFENVFGNITPFVNSQFIYHLSIHNITAESKTAFMHWSY